MSYKTQRIRNWSHYNKSLVARGDLQIWFSEEVLTQWQFTGKRTRGGVKLYTDMAITSALILKELFALTFRSCEGMTRSLLKCLGSSHLAAPNYTTLYRRGRTLPIQLMPKTPRKVHCIIVDATGIHVLGASEWYAFKHKKRQRRQWRKLHLALDHQTQDIVSATVSDGYVHDGKYLPELLNAIEPDCRIDTIIGDGAYTSYECHHAAQDRKSRLIAPPHKNARTQSENRDYRHVAPAPWRDRAIEQVRQLSPHAAGLKQWKDSVDYHRRSLAETAMFRLKTLFGDQVRTKNHEMQAVILKLRCLAINKMNKMTFI